MLLCKMETATTVTSKAVADFYVWLGKEQQLTPKGKKIHQKLNQLLRNQIDLGLEARPEKALL